MKYFEMNKKRYTPEMLEARKGVIENSKTTWWSSTEMCEKYHDSETSFWHYMSLYHGEMKLDEAYVIYYDLWLDNMIQSEPSRVEEKYPFPGSSEMDAIMIDDSKTVDFLEHKINYAANSFSRDLMNQALGMVSMAGVMNLISSGEYVRLSSMICHDYLNNSKWFKHPYYH